MLAGDGRAERRAQGITNAFCRKERLRIYLELRVQGLQTRNWWRVTGAPSAMPMGMRNMLATECSRPMATKVKMGRMAPVTCIP